jgi:hypothetical protein
MTLDDTARETLATAEREALLTVKEYAQLFRVTENGVYIAVRQKRLPYPVERPLGGSIRIRVPVETIVLLRAS